MKFLEGVRGRLGQREKRGKEREGGSEGVSEWEEDLWENSRLAEH